jgi:hypothetical protein
VRLFSLYRREGDVPSIGGEGEAGDSVRMGSNDELVVVLRHRCACLCLSRSDKS